jgi:EpsI family protein
LQGQWMGQESAIEASVLDELKLTDYIKADYRRGSHELPVNFYIAYYQSQRKGSSIHSPRSCIPGGGWVISDLSQLALTDVAVAGDLTLNRLVIQKGKSRQLVYYWFDQRGRTITNEYLAKWYLFWDSLTQQRSDGALVRLVTPVPENSDIKDADQLLQDFLKDFYPLLPDYIPQ